LTKALESAIRKAKSRAEGRSPEDFEGTPGFYLEFVIPKAEAIAVNRIQDDRKKIELVAVREDLAEKGMLFATAFVPDKAEDHFISRVREYANSNLDGKKYPKNAPLIARIEDVRLGNVASLFTDLPVLLPSPGAIAWWEVWLRRGTEDKFRAAAKKAAIRVKDARLDFPERTVVLALATRKMLAEVLIHCDAVAELRTAKDTPAFFMQEQRDGEAHLWIEDLVRLIVPPSADAPAVCILDTGITRLHPLIMSALSKDDCHVYLPAWGKHGMAEVDLVGHGTNMAGLCLYGDLVESLAVSSPVPLLHRLESAKIISPTGATDPKLYGSITQDVVYQAEFQEPERKRVICMAVTSEAKISLGRPTTWSAAIDTLCHNDGGDGRLFIVSAGNVRDLPLNADEYAARNDVEPVEDPAHAWNALTVGAYTDKTTLVDKDFAGWTPLALAGGLCPRSRTSVVWERRWPFKPDVVLEGGNLAVSPDGTTDNPDEFGLLTTHRKPEVRLLDVMGETSTATALAAFLSARILTDKSDLWAETIRALVVHSAEWTPEMKKVLDEVGGSRGKQILLRRYGYGVPDLERALRSTRNDMTLVIQDSVAPFMLDKGTIKSREMNLHRLPWPREELAALGAQTVEVRVTLSYFIEPNPGERGWTKRHGYASHGLRFAMKRGTETEDEFRGRINRAAREEEEGNTVSGSDPSWLLGPKLSTKGSIHSDIWSGSAAELAAKDAIGIYPVGGWWKENKSLGRYDQSARYALVVSIRAESGKIDIYTPVMTAIQAAGLITI
jgi:hypothetical protein